MIFVEAAKTVVAVFEVGLGSPAEVLEGEQHHLVDKQEHDHFAPTFPEPLQLL